MNASKPSTTCASRGGRNRPTAFTLIELLVVISIIGVLAAMVVGLSSRAGSAGREAKVRAELNQLATAIESYKTELGQYPPDNVDGAGRGIPERPPLFYELSGVWVQGSMFYTRDRAEGLTSAQVQTYFNMEGFQNTAMEERKIRRFGQFAPRQFMEIGRAAGDDVEVLVVPVPWARTAITNRFPAPVQVAGRLSVNPWRYMTGRRATNNPVSFDLWADYVEGRRLKRISNWNPKAEVRD